ncbi:hypothetical protein EYE40_06315 [Glaciihabitans arcticus]|uniref:SbsA Ig-like domain-containing protein n=1 Tax=Glaciihabitans arcticus TaxID=2668039 RepID=A0A4Q9GSD7_9MICO|nr:hypothetical protein [Glaciihabitans arcticus]TBN57044.1 hypothetical protein EYE40_06315 [Glaciihabitans arcticus]
MSPTYSERSFRRLFSTLVVTLLVLCAGFLGLGMLQGPKLSSAQLDITRAIDQPGQLLRLFGNQAIAAVDASQVTVTPAAPFTVETSGEVVALAFTERLRYNTAYSVRVTGVTTTADERESEWSYAFETSAPPLVYLDRGAETDEIIRTGVSGNERTVLWSAPHIQDFAVLGQALAVVTLTDRQTSELALVDPADGSTEVITLPADGAITQFAASDTGVLGFSFTSKEPVAGGDLVRTLMRLDLDAGRAPVAVEGLGGAALSVLDWMFVPGSANLIAQTGDQSVMLVEAGGGILPLGQYAEIDHLSIDGTVLTVRDTFGSLSLTIPDLDEQRITPSPLDAAQTFGGELVIQPDGTRVQKVVVPLLDTAGFASYLVQDDGTAARAVYQTVDHAGSIERFELSPNGQYAVIETVPDVATAVSDDYFLDARDTSVTTVIVDLETGAVVRTFDGFAVSW